MYQQMNDAPLLPHHPSPPSSSSSFSRRAWPCCPTIALPPLCSSPYPLAFFSSASLFSLSLILTLTACGVTDWIRLSWQSSVVAYIGAWRICQPNGASTDCSTLTVDELDVLGDSVAFDGFRAFLVLAILFSTVSTLLTIVRFVIHQQHRRSIPRWLDVLTLALCTCTAVLQLLAFSLFLDSYRAFKGAYGGVVSTKRFGSAFVCLLVAFTVQCIALLLHSLTWHFYANTPTGPGYTRASEAAQAMPMAPIHPPQPAQPPVTPQAFNLPAPSSYSASPYFVQAGGFPSLIPPPAQYGQGASPSAAYLHAPSPFPASYLQPGYYSPAAAAALSPAVIGPGVVHYGQGGQRLPGAQ